MSSGCLQPVAFPACRLDGLRPCRAVLALLERTVLEDGYSAAAHLTWQVRVGIMGYGVMGQAAAGLLRAAGYDVAAWARSPHDSADIKVCVWRPPRATCRPLCSVLI